MNVPIIGQEAISTEGLGRVVAYRVDGITIPRSYEFEDARFSGDWIIVVNHLSPPNHGLKYDAKNVELIDPRR